MRATLLLRLLMLLRLLSYRTDSFPPLAIYINRCIFNIPKQLILPVRVK